MAERRELDRLARREAQREFGRPLLLEAGAGTGKTATLVARVLSWCLGPGWEQAAESLRSRPLATALAGRPEAALIAGETLRGLVAITFTEAAAAEMAERVVEALAQVRRGERPVGFDPPALGEPHEEGESARRAGLLLAAADQLQVRTIDAFCLKLLAEHPFEARLHPSFTVDANFTVLQEVVQETLEAALPTAYGDPGDRDFLALAGRGFGPEALAEALLQLRETGLEAADLAVDPFAGERGRELLERARAAINGLSGIITAPFSTFTRSSNARRLADALPPLAARLATLEPGAAAIAEARDAFAELLPKKLLDHLRKWSRGELGKREHEALGELLPETISNAERLYRLGRHASGLDPELLSHARRALGPLHRAVEETLRRRGVLTFADLRRHAEALLERYPQVLRQVRRRIKQLLVDEFQDTDDTQCALVRRLALEGPQTERPGLFIVGDPKQSIYGWRSADLRAYEELAAAVEAAGGQRLPLVENFRSVPPILDEVERLIEPVMRQSPGLQPAFEALVPCERLATSPGFHQLPRAAVEHWISWLPGDSEDDGEPAPPDARAVAELEARAIAADLLTLRATAAVEWQDIALLFRSTTDLETYLSALRDSGIPFVVSRDRQYYRRREIIEAAALVRAVLTPTDRLAVLPCRRASGGGGPAAALLPLWSRRLPQRMAEAQRPTSPAVAEVAEIAAEVAASLPTSIPGLEHIEGWHHNLAYMAACMAELRQIFDEQPADIFVRRLREVTLFETGEASRYHGAYRLANLERFFAELLAALEQADGDRHRVLRRLRTRIEKGFEAEEAKPGGTSTEAVQVMTMHGAKGLQFKHVYLPQLHKKPRGASFETPKAEAGAGPNRGEYRLLGAPTPGFDRVVSWREAVEEAERVRTLYVALTRAEERLIVIGHRSPSGAPPRRSLTHLDLILRRQGSAPSPEELLETWRQGHEGLVHDQVRWFFPARSRSTPPPLETALVERPSLPRLEADAKRLRKERRQARERMARPFSQAASKLAAEAHLEVAAPEPESGSKVGGTGSKVGGTLQLALPEEGGTSRERQAMMAAGTAIHQILEDLDLEEPLEGELARLRDRLPEFVAAVSAPEVVEEAVTRASALLDTFVDGPLLERFKRLAPHIVARELPVLLPPEEGTEGAVGYQVGVIDLLYRDPETGVLVIADFKTDALASAGEVSDHARRYAPQGELYQRAIRDGLGLAEKPRFELWYLDVDHVQVVDLA